jgi:two-component sensor histidine kinase
MYKKAIITFALISLGAILKAQDINEIIRGGLPASKKADTIYTLYTQKMKRGSFEQALELIEKGLPFAMSANELLVSYYYTDRANISYMQSAFEKTKQSSYMAFPWFRKHFNFVNEQSVYILLGSTYARTGKPDSALYYYRLSEELCNKHNPYRNWVTYHEMGLFFDIEEKKEDAEKYYEKAYELTKTKGVRMDHGLSMYHLAGWYFREKKIEKFARLLNEQQEFIKKGKKDYSKDPNHSFLFMDWGTDATLITKIDFLKEVRNRLLQENFGINAAIVNSQIVNLYENEKKYEEALQYVTEGIAIAEKNKITADRLIFAKTAYRIYKKMGNNAAAADMADKVFALKDSVTRMQNMEMAMELDTKYQTEKKEKEIALLNAENKVKENEIALLTSQKKINQLMLIRQKDIQTALLRENELKDSLVLKEQYANQLLSNENQLKTSELTKEQQLKEALARENSLQTAQLQKEKQTRWILLLGTSLLLLSGLVIFGMYQKQKKKNLVIQKQSADLEVLMKEIHHRVKNNLQIVGSLLDLQSHSITDVHAHEAVKEGKNRVQSMALIHQNLYSEGNIKNIKLKEYVNNLLQTLCDSYNISNDKIKVNASIDDLNLDVDTMIPLGLVLNELVSNAFKYAFKEKQNGELNILLKEQSNQLHLIVSDNGTGFPEGLDVKTGKSFGLKMIRAFAQKLKAKLDIYNNNGAVVEMLITKYKVA